MSRIVRAAAISVNSKNKDLSKKIEAAMAQAILKCFEDGITNPDVQRTKILEARDLILGRNT